MTQQQHKMDDDYGRLGYPSEPSAGDSGSVVRTGAPLPEGAPAASYDAVVEALRTVYDPEIPVNIYDLGLIYKLDISGRGDVAVEMTLTAPACPVAGTLPGNVADAVAQVEGTGQIEVKLVWDPPWTPSRMTDDARLALGMD